MATGTAWGYHLSCGDCCFETDSFPCFDNPEEAQKAAESEAGMHLLWNHEGADPYCRPHRNPRVRAQLYFEVTLNED